MREQRGKKKKDVILGNIREKTVPLQRAPTVVWYRIGECAGEVRWGEEVLGKAVSRNKALSITMRIVRERDLEFMEIRAK